MTPIAPPSLLYALACLIASAMLACTGCSSNDTGADDQPTTTTTDDCAQATDAMRAFDENPATPDIDITDPSDATLAALDQATAAAMDACQP